jgi:phage-related protein
MQTTTPLLFREDFCRKLYLMKVASTVWILHYGVKKSKKETLTLKKGRRNHYGLVSKTILHFSVLY